MNESNIFISDTALVTLVDTDSFQVTDTQNGIVYRCPVGTPQFTPPELQGKKFADIDRAPEHDLFGLAVVIFQLLMEGQHPFAGKFQGTGDQPDIPQRISSGHFPHGSNGNVPYDPPTNGLPFATLNPNLQQLFRKCFVDGHRDPKARPDAQAWRYALQGAEDSLQQCSTNGQHFFSGHLSVCPWCVRMQLLGGRDQFPSEDAILRGDHLRPPPRRPSVPQHTRGSSSQGRSPVQTPTPSPAGMSPPIIPITPPPPPRRSIPIGRIFIIATGVVVVMVVLIGLAQAKSRLTQAIQRKNDALASLMQWDLGG